jgi:large subunit ribosomal protein L10
MDKPRPEKVAVVDEVRERLEGSQAALLTEYRGVTVADISTLRRSLRAAGGDYKVYKNTLVRFAARDLGLEIDEMLTGPTAIAFVPKDSTGDPVLVAKALKDFARGNQNLVVKGGILGVKTLSAKDASALADVAPREELLARFAGALQAPMANLASLLQAPLQNLAGLLKALLEEQGGEVLPADEPAGDAGPDTTEPTAAPAPEAAADAESPDTTDAPAAEAAADIHAQDPEAADAADAGTEPVDTASEGS